MPLIDAASAASVVMATVLYLNSLHGDFAYDDSRAILRNPDIAAESPVANIFVDDFWGTPLTHSGSHKSYRPLCVLSFRWNRYLAGNSSGAPDPFGFHVTNVVLHASVSLLFTCLARSLFLDTTPTAFAGLAFAAHPVHTEAVAGIVGRADVGACLFYLLSLASYMKYCAYRSRSHLEPQPRRSNGSTAHAHPLPPLTHANKCPRHAYRLLFAAKKGSPSPSGGGKGKDAERKGVGVGDAKATLDLPGTCLHQRWRPLTSAEWRIVFLAGCVLSGLLSMLFKELGITVFGICLLYDIFIIHRLSVRCFYHIFSKDCLSHLREGLLVLVASCISLLLLRIWLMGFKTPEFAASDNPAAHDPSAQVRTLTYLYLPVFNMGLLLFPKTLSFDWSMDAVPLLRMFKDQRNLLSVIFYSWLGYSALRTWWKASSTLTSYLDNIKSSQKEANGTGEINYGEDAASPRPPVCLCARRHIFPVIDNRFFDAAFPWQRTINKGSQLRIEDSRDGNHRISDVEKSASLLCFGSLAFPCIRWTRMDRVLLSLSLLVIPFLPATNLFFSVGFVVAERILYIPSAGFCLLIAEGFLCLLNLFAEPSKVSSSSSSSSSSFVSSTESATSDAATGATNPGSRRRRAARAALRLMALVVVASFSLRTWHRNRDWQTEENLYLAGIKVNPPKAWGNLGNILNSKRRHAEAERAYRHALTFRSNMADVHYNLGILLQEQKRSEEAIESYQRAITCRPKLTVAHLNQGIVLAQIGRSDEAKRAYVNCWNVDSSGLKDPRLHESTRISCLYNLARLHADSGDIEEAIRVYRAAVDQRPAHYAPQSLFNMLGEAYFKNGDLRSAKQWYEEALGAKPDHVPAHLTMAHLVNKQGDATGAESWFQRALELAPKSLDALQHYAQFLADGRRFDAAIDVYRRALAVSASDFEIVFNIANCFREIGSHDEAERFYRQAVLLRPEAPTAHMNLGAMLHLSGKLKEAETSYLEALRLKPTDATTKLNLLKLRQLKAKS